MGSASSKKSGDTTASKVTGLYSGEPGAIEIHSIGSGVSATIEGYVNTISESNEGIKDIKNSTVRNECLHDFNNDASKHFLVNDGTKNNVLKTRKPWDSYSRRESRFRGKEKCLVGLENIRRTASPQLLMASRENYGRIKDASDLLRLHPSETDVCDTKSPVSVPPSTSHGPKSQDITNQSIFKEVSDISIKGSSDASKCSHTQAQDIVRLQRSPPHSGAEKATNVTHYRGKTGMNVSPCWLKSDLKPSTSSQKKMPDDLNVILHDRKVPSRENSFNGLQGMLSDGKSASLLAPLRYGKLGIQGGAIRKELEKEGILGLSSEEKKNPDVVLRELRQMGLVRQTGSSVGYSLEAEEVSRVTRASRLPPLEYDALCRRLEEKEKRHKEQINKNETVRQEKVHKFNERHKSAKARRQQLQQQQQQPTQAEREAEAERIKLKMLDTDIL